MTYGLPVGGTLGRCALCGESFLREIMLNESIATVDVDGVAGGVAVHRDGCAEKLVALNGKSWEELPDGPLRAAFARFAAANSEA